MFTKKLIDDYFAGKYFAGNVLTSSPLKQYVWQM